MPGIETGIDFGIVELTLEIELDLELELGRRPEPEPVAEGIVDTERMRMDSPGAAGGGVYILVQSRRHSSSTAPRNNCGL